MALRVNILYGLVCLLAACMLFAATPGYAKTKIDPDRVEAANQALREALATGTPSLHYMRAKLNMGEFEAVEGLYKDAMDRYQENVVYEHYLLRGYELFCTENKISLSSLDAWIAATGSAPAYAARGIYKSQMGRAARGGKVIGQTPPENLALMMALYLEAVEDLLAALDRDPSLTPVYVHLIRIAMSAPMPTTPTEVLNEALRHDQRTYYVRHQYMQSLLPRWGGSVTEMWEFMHKFVESVDLNPRLYSLLGEITASQGDHSYWQKDYKDAAMRYTLAMKFGERTAWLRSRGMCYFHLGEHEKAMDDFIQVLHYKPSDQNALQWVQYTQAEKQKK